MAQILLTGIATLDIINHVEAYPQEDDEVRALDQELRRGGNAANTASILQQLGHHCSLACTLADDLSGQFIHDDISGRGINYDPTFIIAKATSPTSYITLNQQTGSRTIVHYRDLDELNARQFQSINLSSFDWLHFEGRNIDETEIMMQQARKHNAVVSLEAEKPRPQIEHLFEHASVIMFSRPFAESRGHHQAPSFLLEQSLRYPHTLMTCTWGDQGAWAIQNQQLSHSQAFVPPQVRDTIGAGDTFNAGLIHSLLDQQPIAQALSQACTLAGQKCGQLGFEGLTL